MTSLTVNPDYKQYQTDAYQIAGISTKSGKGN